MPLSVSDTAPALGQKLLPGAAAALQRHIESSTLGGHILPNVFRALANEGRLLESEQSAALGCLVLLAHESAGGEDPRDAYPAVIAMECLLAAGDVLDDIQDGDLELKGWESSAVAAETMAALLVLAHDALSDAAVQSPGIMRALRRFTTLEQQALRGQATDVRTAATDISHLESLEIARAKSGTLGRCAAEMGASIATDDQSSVASHGDFGEHLAVVFQLMNDIAGIWPGHTAHSDLRNQRPTTAVGFVASVTDSVSKVCSLETPVAESGAVQFTWALATAEVAKARRKANEILTRNPDSRLSILLHR